MNEEQLEKAAEIAKKIMHNSQNTLLLNLRFMDVAIFRLSPKQANTTLATDGRYIYYGVSHILSRFKAEQTQIVRDTLHVILHCVFRHSFVKSSIDTGIWNLATDIAVENVINSLGIRSVNTKRVSGQLRVMNELSFNLRSVTAEHIYRYYKDKNISNIQAKALQVLFESDDHTCWYNLQEQYRLYDQNSENEQLFPTGFDENGVINYENRDVSSINQSRTTLEEEWKKASRQIQMEMETFSKGQGALAGNLIQQLCELNKEKYDYSIFLEKFAVMGEVMKTNDDEFDYIFYTHGLNLFGNVPLIEPLEYKDEKRIREFIIAIDTSGSTSGSLVQKFLKKTYNILKNSESFFSKINLHIIQCDVKIQEHIKITRQEEFDDYINKLTIKGLGGTDFRPVFETVERMVQSKEFHHLKGMIYFTDGYGTFPAKKPCFDTAFVFIRNDFDNPIVPPWAIKIILNDEEI